MVRVPKGRWALPHALSHRTADRSEPERRLPRSPLPKTWHAAAGIAPGSSECTKRIRDCAKSPSKTHRIPAFCSSPTTPPMSSFACSTPEEQPRRGVVDGRIGMRQDAADPRAAAATGSGADRDRPYQRSRSHRGGLSAGGALAAGRGDRNAGPHRNSSPHSRGPERISHGGKGDHRRHRRGTADGGSSGIGGDTPAGELPVE